jgi:hypothetical protein
MSKQPIALVGGTGNLGTLIANALLDKPDAQLRLLVRPGSRDKVARLEGRGAQIIEGEIGLDAGATLPVFCRGASAIVSAVQGGPDVIIDGQALLLRTARDAGVRRFVPADYVANLFKVPPGRIPPLDWRREFAAVADAERGTVEVVHVLNGGFLDRRVLFSPDIVDVHTRTAYVWGDGSQTMVGPRAPIRHGTRRRWRS